MPRLKTGRRRNRSIRVRLDEEELAEAQRIAASVGMTPAEYLRSVHTRRTVRAVVDLDAVVQLGRQMGDLSRLGGLFKLWLARDPRAAALDVSTICEAIEQRLARLEGVADAILPVADGNEGVAQQHPTARSGSSAIE
jgi:hypothetical protein